MKKLICVILILLTLLFNYSISYANYNPNPLGLEQEMYDDIIKSEYSNSAFRLKLLGIVSSPYEKWPSHTDPITRRSAFEMAFVVRNGGHRVLCTKDHVEYFDDYMEQGGEPVFADIEAGTYDYYLTCALFWESYLMNGKIDENGQRVANLDEYITYKEALTILSRLMIVEWRTDDIIIEKLQNGGDEALYNLFYDVGLINSNSMVSYSSINLNFEDLNKEIPAREYMHLIHSFLYIPILHSSCYGNMDYGFRYIDHIKTWSDVTPEDGDVIIP